MSFYCSPISKYAIIAIIVYLLLTRAFNLGLDVKSALIITLLTVLIMVILDNMQMTPLLYIPPMGQQMMQGPPGSGPQGPNWSFDMMDKPLPKPTKIPQVTQFVSSGICSGDQCSVPGGIDIASRMNQSDNDCSSGTCPKVLKYGSYERMPKDDAVPLGLTMPDYDLNWNLPMHDKDMNYFTKFSPTSGSALREATLDELYAPQLCTQNPFNVYSAPSEHVKDVYSYNMTQAI